MFIQPAWPCPARIKAYTTLRRGSGVSLPPYNEFNLAFHGGDNSAHVALNRQYLHDALSFPSEPIWINQVHGTHAVEAIPANTNQEADASFAHDPHHVCVILTADCLPILLCDKQATEVAAIHAGWRGLAKGVIENTLQNLQRNNEDFLAWLGPAIGPKKFEVGEEVYEIFVSLLPANKTAFTRTTATTWLANIYELARIQLHLSGVSAIYGGEHCTHTQSADFFSYRRDQKQTGRMANLIWIE